MEVGSKNLSIAIGFIGKTTKSSVIKSCSSEVIKRFGTIMCSKGFTLHIDMVFVSPMR